MPNRSKRDISETYFVIIIYHNLQRFECFILKNWIQTLFVLLTFMSVRLNSFKIAVNRGAYRAQ